MRRTLALAAVTGALVLTPATLALADSATGSNAPVVVAQDTTEDVDGESDKTGLWGLLGLLGLAGLVKRRTEDRAAVR